MKIAKHTFLTPFVALALVLSASATPSRAELISNGPVIAVGIVDTDDKNGDAQTFANISAGWRFTYEDFESWDNWLSGAGIDLTFVVEPMFGVLTQGRGTVEVSVLPMFRLEPDGAETFFPYFEGGIGLMYNDLRGFDLGSRITFRDEGGIGLAYRLSDGHRIGIGYRFRHISHAGLWADANDGLNTHFLVLTYE